MKRLIFLSLFMVLALAVAVYAGTTTQGIQGTPHDIPVFYSAQAGATSTEPCAFCHTPHVPDAQDNAAQLVYPLWNRSQASQTYTLYTSPTHGMYQSSTKTSAQLDQSTRVCMMCHNGQAGELLNYPGRGRNANHPNSAVYNFSGVTLGNSANLGLNLKPDHPVSFTYNTALDTQDNGFPGTASIGGRTVVNSGGQGFPLYNTNELAGTIMGCGTCHEPHDRFLYIGKSTTNTGTQVFFLRNSDGSSGTSNGTTGGNAGSSLCRACHVNRY